MPKPLRSELSNPPSVQFSHFGLLNDGPRSKAATVTSLVINVLMALVIVVLGMVVKKNPQLGKTIASITLPPPVKIEAPPPPHIPPPPPVHMPTPPKIQPPKVKIEPPKIPPPPEPKPSPTPPAPKPAQPTPPAPKRVEPAPAPKVVTIKGMAASVPNNDIKPTPVQQGFAQIRPTGPPQPTKIAMNEGMPGMPASNTGHGPRSVSINEGSGNPSGTNLAGRATGVKIAGIENGCVGCTGTGKRGPVSVGVGNTMGTGTGPGNGAREAVRPPASGKPTLIYKPKPVYPEEARSQHIEGNVQVRVRVTPQGTTEFVAITKSLGHGLDESARQVVQGMRWKPATDSNGRPTEWEGDVVVVFELS